MLLLALLLAAEPLHVSISAGTGIAYQSAGVQLSIRSEHWGAFAALGAPTLRGLIGVSGGMRWLRGDGNGLMLSLQGALQGLPDGGNGISIDYRGNRYYGGDGYSQAAVSISATIGGRLRRGPLFLDLTAGPVLHYLIVAPYKQGSYRYQNQPGGWQIGPLPAPSTGSWPLPIDVTIALGVEL